MVVIHTGPIMLHPDGYKTSLEDITPARAAEYLKANTKNVPTKPSKIKAYVDDLKAGRWTPVPGSIVFSSDGVLMNGQHRLLAIIESGITLKSYEVKSGYSFDHIAAIDPDKEAWTHAHRRGARNAKASCSIAKLALNWLEGQSLTTPLSKPMISNYVVENPWLQDIAGYAARANFRNEGGVKKRITIPAGPLGAAIFVSTMGGIGRELVPEFIAGLTVDPLEWVAGDPRHALARYMQSVDRERARIQASDVDVFNACAQAWEHHVKREKCRYIVFNAKNTAGVEVINAVRNAARKVAPPVPVLKVA